jgi:hypothetical protein
MNFDTSRFATEQFQCLVTYGNNLAIVTIDSDDGRFVQENSPARLIDEGVDSTQVDGKLVLEKFLNKLHGDGSSSKLAGFREASYSLPSGNSYA